MTSAKFENRIRFGFWATLNNITLATAKTSLAHRRYSTKVGVLFKASRWVGNSDVQASGFQASGGSL